MKNPELKKSVRLLIRASEFRSEINQLAPGEETIAKRTELLAGLNTIEGEYRTELTAEAEAEADTPDSRTASPVRNASLPCWRRGPSCGKHSGRS